MSNKTYRKSFTDKAVVDEYVTRYSGVTLSSYLFDLEKKILSDIVKNEINATAKGGVKYLDYACGTGRVLNFIIERFSDSEIKLDAVGMDISEEMLATITGSPARLVKIDISTESASENGFDLITCFRFFLNAENDLRNSVLRQLHIMLKEDGCLVINNHGSCSSFLGLLRFFKKNTHCMDDLKFLQMLSANGFEVKTVYGLGLLPGIIVNRRIFRFLFLGFEKYLIKSKWGKVVQKFQITKLYVCKKI